jgi:hypothetical protein
VLLFIQQKHIEALKVGLVILDGIKAFTLSLEQL